MAKRPNILKLATKISLESMTYTGITYNDPEYKILEPIIDDEMCAIMMHLRLEANRTVEDVAKRAKQSVEYTQTQLDKLAKTGAVRMAAASGTPVVPVFVTRNKTPFCPIRVIFGEPYPVHVDPEDHAACQQASDALLKTIYQLGGDSYADQIS